MRQAATYKKATLAVDWEVTTLPHLLGQGRPDEHYTCRSRMVAGPVCSRVYPADFPTRDHSYARSHFDYGTAHRGQHPAHGEQSRPRRSFELSTRAVQRALVRVANGLCVDTGDRALFLSQRCHPAGGRRHGRRTPRQEGLRQGAASRSAALEFLVHGPSLRSQMGGVVDLGKVSLCQTRLGLAGADYLVSFPQRQSGARQSAPDPGRVDAADAAGLVALVSGPVFSVRRRRQFWHPRTVPLRSSEWWSLELGQSLSRRCQFVRAGAAPAPEQEGWPAAAQGSQDAATDGRCVPIDQAAKTDRRLVWRRTAARGSSDGHRTLVQERSRV